MTEMQAYIRRPEPVRAVQWHKPGDHPDDYEYCGSWCIDVSLGVPSELEPGCWIVDGEHHGREVFDDDLFRKCFAPSAAPWGGAAVDAAGHNGPMDATHNEARDRAAAEARPELTVTIGERDGATTIEVPDGVPSTVADELAGAFAELMGGRVVGVARDGAAEDHTLRSQVLALADLKDGWYDGEGEVYDAGQLEAVAGVLERLAGITEAGVFPTPEGRILVEWVDRPRSDSLEIDPATLHCEWHLCDVDTNEVIIGEMMPESLAEARPQVGEATRRVLQTLWWMVERRVHDGSLKPVAIAAWSDETHGRLTDARIEGADILAALRECGMEDVR